MTRNAAPCSVPSGSSDLGQLGRGLPGTSSDHQPQGSAAWIASSQPTTHCVAPRHQRLPTAGGITRHHPVQSAVPIAAHFVSSSGGIRRAAIAAHCIVKPLLADDTHPARPAWCTGYQTPPWHHVVNANYIKTHVMPPLVGRRLCLVRHKTQTAAAVGQAGPGGPQLAELLSLPQPPRLRALAHCIAPRPTAAARATRDSRGRGAGTSAPPAPPTRSPILPRIARASVHCGEQGVRGAGCSEARRLLAAAPARPPSRPPHSPRSPMSPSMASAISIPPSRPPARPSATPAPMPPPWRPWRPWCPWLPCPWL